jgi:AraC family transcriptional regulator
METSLSEQKTAQLWKSFRPKIKSIKNVRNSGFYSVQIFEDNLRFDTFTPHTRFQKWAAVEVDDFVDIPDGIESFILPEGKYAVFVHKGLPADFPYTSRFIHGEWMPSSLYELDNRPHFEIMQEDYSSTDSEAEEEVWIPIKEIKWANILIG